MWLAIHWVIKYISYKHIKRSWDWLHREPRQEAFSYLNLSLRGQNSSIGEDRDA